MKLEKDSEMIKQEIEDIFKTKKPYLVIVREDNIVELKYSNERGHSRSILISEKRYDLDNELLLDIVFHCLMKQYNHAD